MNFLGFEVFDSRKFGKDFLGGLIQVGTLIFSGYSKQTVASWLCRYILLLTQTFNSYCNLFSILYHLLLFGKS